MPNQNDNIENDNIENASEQIAPEPPVVEHEGAQMPPAAAGTIAEQPQPQPQVVPPRPVPSPGPVIEPGRNAAPEPPLPRQQAVSPQPQYASQPQTIPATAYQQRTASENAAGPFTQDARPAAYAQRAHSPYEPSATPGAPVAQVPRYPGEPKQKSNVPAIVATGVLCGILGFSSAMFGNMVSAPKATSPAASNSASTAPDTATSSTPVTTVSADHSTTATQVAQKCLPSVVSIYVYTEVQQFTMDDLYDYYFGGGGYGYGYSNRSPEYSPYGRSDQGRNTDDSAVVEEMSGLGSGVIISEDGYILTNSHVVSDSSSIKVKVDDTEYDAEIVGVDDSSDLAVIKIDATGLSAIEFGNSDDCVVGDWCMAIGSPYGYEKTVTAGIISALDRSGARTSATGNVLYSDMIQTDASINFGNSGGALVNSEGQLIGINTLLSSSSTSSAGIGFAISGNYAKQIAEQLMSNGAAEHAVLGVKLDDSADGDGAYVRDVIKGSAAENAGIKSGDIITEVAGEKIDSARSLMLELRTHEIGEKVTVKIQRGDNTAEVTAELASDATATK